MFPTSTHLDDYRTKRMDLVITDVRWEITKVEVDQRAATGVAIS